MTKADLIRRVHENKELPRGLSKKTLQTIVECLFTEIGDYFIRAKPSRGSLEKFTYPGFGTFSKRRRPARTIGSFGTKEPIVIPAQFTVVFSPSSTLKEWMNRGRSKVVAGGK